MGKLTQRILASALSFVLVVGLMPSWAFAAELVEPQDASSNDAVAPVADDQSAEALDVADAANEETAEEADDQSAEALDVADAANEATAEEGASVAAEGDVQETPVLRDAKAALQDGTYKVPGLSTAVLSMYHFDSDTARVVIKGDDAWLITGIDGQKEPSTLKRFDGMAYGPQSTILDSTDETNHTLVAGTPVAKVVETTDEDTGAVATRTFVLPVPKSVFENGSDIYYMIKYRAGYSGSHDGDWYKADGGDYYLTGYSLQFESDSTVLPGDDTPAPQPEVTELEISNTTTMFKAVSASAAVAADGSAALIVALSGTSYHWLYKGTYEEALAAKDQIAADIAADTPGDKLFKYAVNDEGKYEFQIPVASDEFGKVIPVVSISNTYYQKFVNDPDQNPLERAFFPRQFVIDLDAETLVVGDYDNTVDFTLTSEVEDFKAASPVSVRVVGGPNSNNYSVAPTFVMQDATYDSVTYPTVPSGTAEEPSTATAALTDGKFAITMVNIPKVAAFQDKTPLTFTFHVAESAPYEEAGTDVIRTVTFDQVARTIKVEGTALTPKAAELTAGTYEATKVSTDVTTDASGMIMVTKATVVIDEKGNATAIVTMKGRGADRLYVSDTATAETIIGEAVAEEAKEIDGQFSKLIGPYTMDGETAYTFWPIPITLGQPKIYAARSASHFNKWDLPREKYFYVHDFQIDEADLVRVSDSTSVMSPEADAQVYMNQFFVNNGISTNHAGVIKAKGTNVTVPYYDDDASKISSFIFKRAETDKFRSGWFIDNSILNTTYFTSSNLKKIRYPEGSNGTVTFNPKAAVRNEGMTFTATLKLYPADAEYNQYDAEGVYYDKEPLAEQTFTITVAPQPQVDFNVSVSVTDQKTGEAVGNPTIVVTDESDSSVVEPNEDGTYKLNALKKYTVAASAEGYLAQGGAAQATKTGFSPSKEGEVVALKLLKEADASHILTLSIADQFGEAVANPVVKVWLYGTTDEVAPNDDGSYTLWDSESYVCEVSAEGYETAKIYPTLTEDKTETIKVNKYLSEHTVTYTIRDADTDEVLDDVTLVVTNNTAGGTIPQNEDGSFTVPADTSITCVASKEGYLTSDGFTHVPSGFEPVVACSFSLKVNFKTQLTQEIAKATEYAGTIVEAEEPGKWPVGTKAPLEAAIADAQAVLDNAASTESEFEQALTTLKAAEKTAQDAQYACEATVTVRVNKTPGGAAELYKIKVSADASKTYKYSEPTTEGKQVTFLDLLIALHEDIYGDAFKANPKTYFDSENVGWYYIKTLFQSGNYFTFAFNGKAVSDNGYQKFIVADGGVADVSLMTNASDVFLSFDKLEAEASAGEEFTATLTQGARNESPAEGYTVTYADENGTEVSGITDAEGKITVTFQNPGDYTVKSVAKESESKSLVQPYQKVTVVDATPAAGQYVVDVKSIKLAAGSDYTMFVPRYDGINNKALVTVADDGSATISFDNNRNTYNAIYLGELQAGSEAGCLNQLPTDEQKASSAYITTKTVGTAAPYEFEFAFDTANVGKTVPYVTVSRSSGKFNKDQLAFVFGDAMVTTAAFDVISEIDSLPAAADVTIRDKDAIESARAAYEALSAAQKAEVTNLDKLVAAEQAYAALPAKDEQTIAVENLINALITQYTEVNDATAAAVAEARTAYNALTKQQQAYIDDATYHKLARAEACVQFATVDGISEGWIVDVGIDTSAESPFIAATISPRSNAAYVYLYTAVDQYNNADKVSGTVSKSSHNLVGDKTIMKGLWQVQTDEGQGREFVIKLTGPNGDSEDITVKVPGSYGTMDEGTYEVQAIQDPESRMRKFESAVVTSDGSAMTVTFTMPNTTYGEIFLGTKEQAAADNHANAIQPTGTAPTSGTTGEGNVYTIPLESLYQPMFISYCNLSKDTWTQETVTFVIDEQAQAVVDAIAALELNTYFNVTADQREQVQTAKALYDALDDNQKAIVNAANGPTLRKVVAMFEIADIVAAEIEALPKAEDVTAADVKAIYGAKADFDGMGSSDIIKNALGPKPDGTPNTLQNSQIEKLVAQELRDKLAADLAAVNDLPTPYHIALKADPSFVLDVAGAVPTVGANVSVWTNNGGSNQLFTVEPGENGGVVLRNVANPDLVLDAAGKVPEVGANVSTWTANGGLNQEWELTGPDADGYYTIVSKANPELGLDAAGAQPKIGANVGLWTSTGAANQAWKLVPANDLAEANATASGMIRNIINGRAAAPQVSLTLNGEELTAGFDYTLSYGDSAKVPTTAGTYTVTAKAVDGSRFAGEKVIGELVLVDVSESVALGTDYRIVSASDQAFILDVAAAMPERGANVSIWTSNGGANQLFTMDKSSDGYYVLRNVANPELVLDAAGAEPKIGANVSTWSFNDGMNQKWILLPDEKGIAIASAANPEFVLDAAGEQPAIGANVGLWSDNQGLNQRWSFVTANDLAYADIEASGFDRNATGMELSPVISVALNGKELAEGTDYTVKYNGSDAKPTEPGAYAVSVEGMGDVAGEVTIGTFNIYPAPVELGNANPFHLVSAADESFVLDVAGQTPVSGANVSIWTNNGGANQMFMLGLGQDGYYTLLNQANPLLVLDAAGAEPKIGANVSTYEHNGGMNQKWVLVPSEKVPGFYSVRSAANTDFALDAAGAKPEIGANVSIWTFNEGPNQLWKLMGE